MGAKQTEILSVNGKPSEYRSLNIHYIMSVFVKTVFFQSIFFRLKKIYFLKGFDLVGF